MHQVKQESKLKRKEERMDSEARKAKLPKLAWLSSEREKDGKAK